MKNLAQKFLSEANRDKIKKAVSQVERKTSGEIVPMVVSSSYHYPMANVIGATAFALPVSILLTLFLGGLIWLGTWNMWLFIALFTVSFLVFHFLLDQIPGLKRVFVSEKEIAEEVAEAAMIAFYREGLYRTRDETGVLIFISVFERKVWVLADRGINQKVDESQWQAVVRHIVEGIKNKRQGEAVCEAVEMVGRILETHFPVKKDDTDELQNLIIEH